MVKAKVYKYVSPFKGLPQKSNIEIVEEELPPLQNGEFLAKAVYLSVDPYIRIMQGNYELGSIMIGQQVALITESKNPKFPVGKYVLAFYGWRSHTVSTGTEPSNVFHKEPPCLVDFGGMSPSLALGALGTPGMTAYFGFLKICDPQPGETVVVSGAAGAVGSLVGQIAKIKGCKVIGIAGSDKKGEWLVNELGFDHFINYKTDDIDQKLSKVAPQGVDAYFDNVGGQISSSVLKQMNTFGRVSVCGVLSSYNNEVVDSGYNQSTIIVKNLTIKGFVVYRWLDIWMEGVNQMRQWILEGKIKYNEHITEGFGNMFEAWVDTLNGGSTGKSIVKV